MAADHWGKFRFIRSDETESSLVEFAELSGNASDKRGEEESGAPPATPPAEDASGQRGAAPTPGPNSGNHSNRSDDAAPAAEPAPGNEAELRQLRQEFAALGARFDPAQRGAAPPEGEGDGAGDGSDDRRQGVLGLLRQGPSDEPPRRPESETRDAGAEARPRMAPDDAPEDAPDDAMAAAPDGVPEPANRAAEDQAALGTSTVVDEAEPPLTEWTAEAIDRLFRDGGDRVEALGFAQQLAEDIAAGRFHVSFESCVQRSVPEETAPDARLYRRAGGDGAQALLKYRAAKWLLARGASGVDFDLQVYPPDQETADVFGYSVHVLVECGGTAPSKVARALGLTSWTTFAFLPSQGERIYLFKATVDGERAVRFRYGRAYLERVRAAVAEAEAEAEADGLEPGKVDHRAAEIVSAHWSGISWFEACTAVERMRRYARLGAHRHLPPPARPAPPFPQT